LKGTLPSQIADLPYLTYSRINGNEFTGQLPAELGNLTQMVEFWYHENLFSGSIPPQLGQLRRMQDVRCLSVFNIGLF
jgi:hypothetical protein